MPIYEYRCENGHLFEVFQNMSDDPVAECEECGAPVERVFHPVAVHFKGSGFYTTDYAKKKAPAGAAGGDSGSGDSSGGDSGGDSKGESGGSKSQGGGSGSGSSSSESKAATKSSSSSD